MPKAERSTILKEENKANTAETANAVRTLAAVDSRTDPTAQTIATTNEAGQRVPITSAAGAYANNEPVKSAVDAQIGAAVQKMQDLNIAPLSVDKQKNATITTGVGPISQRRNYRDWETDRKSVV